MAYINSCRQKVCQRTVLLLINGTGHHPCNLRKKMRQPGESYGIRIAAMSLTPSLAMMHFHVPNSGWNCAVLGAYVGA